MDNELLNGQNTPRVRWHAVHLDTSWNRNDALLFDRDEFTRNKITRGDGGTARNRSISPKIRFSGIRRRMPTPSIVGFEYANQSGGWFVKSSGATPLPANVLTCDGYTSDLMDWEEPW